MSKLIDGRWGIVEKLGEGGQAETFLVIDTGRQFGRVVLKRLKNPHRLPRFKQEIDALSKLDHPKVLKLLASNADAEKPYLVSEYCERGTLEQQRESILRSSLSERFDIFEQICEGVAAAHAQGIIHRDIKPANVFVRDSGEIVVGDFGICFIETPERLTETLEAVGPRFYMAPELADGRIDDVTARSDIYSLGKVLYWLLTGKVFDREDHRRGDRDLTNVFKDPAIRQVHRLLDRMIADNPAVRITDARMLQLEFKEIRRLVEGKFPTLERPPELCRYCGNGTYKLLGNSQDKSAVFSFGFDPTNTVPHIFVCQNCGHVEMFRPAYSKNPNWLGS